MFDIKQFLQQLSTEERRKLFPALDDDAFQTMMRLPEAEMMSTVQKCVSEQSKTAVEATSQHRWFDDPLCGLSDEGNKHLNELIEQLNTPGFSHHVDRKQVRCLKQLKKCSFLFLIAFERRPILNCFIANW